MKEIFNGLESIHDKQIVHWDLKPENVLLTPNKEAKISDFGSAKFIDKKNSKNSPYVVSQYYRAPELFLNITDYDGGIDVWASGCILAELLIGRPLF